MERMVPMLLETLSVLGCMATILLFLMLFQWQKARAEAERKIRQAKMSSLYYEAYDELLTLVRERQHDMNNHINAILGMIYTIDNYEDLVRSQREYLCEVMEQSHEARLLLAIENPLVIGFIYRKIQQADQYGIRVEHQIAMGEKETGVPDYELIEILGILFDNAMDALIGSAEGQKLIRLEISCENIRLWICVANVSRVFAADEIERFFQEDYTSKGKGHGVGLKKLRKIVLHRKGEIMVSNKREGNVNFLEFCVWLPGKESPADH